jgi:DNA-binding CsgD family transcriptional regulator
MADARGHLKASRQLSTDPRIPLPYGRCLLGLASLARDEQNTEEAWELAHESLGVLFEYGDRIGAATALEAIADVAVELGDSDLALRLLGASESFHQETGIVRFPLEAERLDRARTAAAAALDERDAAACWESGRSLALEEAVAHARRGRGKRGRPQTGWGSLTPAERDVVRLVAEGRSNAEIGERLFISLNTVKTHLTHVYAKVDVDRRADLAAQAARRGL